MHIHDEIHRILEQWEADTWTELYENDICVDRKLAKISAKLGIRSIPEFDNKAAKHRYLSALEDRYHRQVYLDSHEMYQDEPDWDLPDEPHIQ